MQPVLVQAAILTGRRNKDATTLKEVDDSVDRIVAGMEGTPMVDSKSKSLVAYHEVLPLPAPGDHRASAVLVSVVHHAGWQLPGVHAAGRTDLLVPVPRCWHVWQHQGTCASCTACQSHWHLPAASLRVVAGGAVSPSHTRPGPLQWHRHTCCRARFQQHAWCRWATRCAPP